MAAGRICGCYDPGKCGAGSSGSGPRTGKAEETHRMTATVAVPLWAFVILAGFAGWAVLVLLLVPGMRWFFRRRIKEVLHQIGARMNIELPSFKLTRRRVLIDRLFHDHKVQTAAAAHAVVSNEALGEIWRRIDRYAREIVPSFNA
jgi:glycerol-3-phosphate O-acyltransferase